MKKPFPLADDLHLLNRKASEASACESEKVKKVKSIFGPLNLFIFGYVKGGVLGNNNIGIKKCTTTFLWVLNLGQVGEILENFQNHPLGEKFLKNILKSVILEKIVKGFPWKKLRFFFSKIFT